MGGGGENVFWDLLTHFSYALYDSALVWAEKTRPFPFLSSDGMREITLRIFWYEA